MIDEYDLQRFNFGLNEAKPVHVILNSHKDFNDHYFDMHYEYELGVLINGRMKREYIDYQMEIGPGDVWFCCVCHRPWIHRQEQIIEPQYSFTLPGPSKAKAKSYGQE